MAVTRNVITCEAKVEVTPVMLAEAFCSMGDEDQAQFFIEAARIARGWRGFAATMQWHYVGRHLATCACSTGDAREMVREISETANRT
jgi:hypothetical protein